MSGSRSEPSEGGGAEGGAGWRATELEIVGGTAHALNSALTGLTLAAEMARMDEELSGEALDVIEQQSARLQSEIELLFSLLGLEGSTAQLHNPLELARAATRLFERLPASIRATVRITATGEAGAVEVSAGACIRAIILCLRAFTATFERPGVHDIELHVHRAGAGVGMEVRCDDAAVAPAHDFLGTAVATLGEDSGARLLTADGRVTLLMQAPRRGDPTGDHSR